MPPPDRAAGPGGAGIDPNSPEGLNLQRAQLARAIGSEKDFEAETQALVEALPLQRAAQRKSAKMRLANLDAQIKKLGKR